ncbi:hypothetical protein HPB50_003475 [Hyalomma asiaticum]|uniref:Uncharacterized protein n=1 Tax=Hyalomma asiaticum TaxID=266040 RepID=A0ACB7RYZ1_HYAAI|nr:hypothetical protein HPB50_003475 [Hyalomma asiaticum]
MPNDTLTLKREVVTLHSGTMSTPGTSSTDTASPALPECRLSSNLPWLLESDENEDVTLLVGRETFPAHKSVLSARSPVFRDMFARTATEDDQVVIADVEPDVFADLLRFIYTGCAPKPIAKPDSLLRAAELYKLDGLKVACELALISRMSVETAADTLILAHQNDADTLRSRVLGFVCSHIDDVVETPGWTTLCKGHIELLEMLLTTLINESSEPRLKRSRNS